MTILGVIPARLASSRLPNKMLLAQTGKPLVQHTWESACRAKRVDRVMVATDSPEIQRVCAGFGAEAVLTGECASGTDRIAFLLRQHAIHADILVNIQGDEPEIDPDHIDRVVDTLLARPDVAMATAVVPIRELEKLRNPACVKAVLAHDGRALYFSRTAIPHVRDEDPEQLLARDPATSPWYQHLGLYAYRREFLLQLTEQPVSPLENLEKLEQLRALEMGASIAACIVPHATAGIDTPADYAAFVARRAA